MFFKLYPEIHEITSKYGYINEIYKGDEEDNYIVIENNKKQ